MKILAVDTSSSVAAAAVMEGSKLLGEYVINHKKTHSVKLMPMIMELLSTLELKPADMDAFAASSGPGSFTGLRIGVTAVKSMAYAAGKPVIGIPTMDALAFNLPEARSLICPIMDARNNQVYTAVYRWEGNIPVRATDYLGIHISELVNKLKEMDGNVIFNGDGVEMHRDFLKAELGAGCSFAPGSLMLQRASSVAQAAMIKLSEGLSESAFDMVPFYLRKSQAEREYEKKCTVSCME